MPQVTLTNILSVGDFENAGWSGGAYDPFSSSNYQFRIDFNNAYTAGTIWVDGAMLIDLTACFGSDNEPDKTFCDALPFFTGTMLYPPISARAKVDGEWKNVSSIYQKRGRHGLP